MSVTYDISIYFDEQGRCPWKAWLVNLRDSAAIFKIETRIKRLSNGNFGDHRHLGGNLFELRIDYGPGYRAYCYLSGKTLIILLCGGDKSSQQAEIKRAHAYIDDIKRRV